MSDAVIIAIVAALVAMVNVSITAVVVVKVRDVHKLVDDVSKELKDRENS